MPFLQACSRSTCCIHTGISEEDTGLLQGLRSVGMQRKLPFGGYFAVFFADALLVSMMWAVREFQSTKTMILLILPLGGSSYRVSEYIPPVVMHASSIHESFISSKTTVRTFLLVVILIIFSRRLCSSMACTTWTWAWLCFLVAAVAEKKEELPGTCIMYFSTCNKR